jgi:hypothetical protein
MSKTDFTYRTADESIPPASLAFMASRAGRSRPPSSPEHRTWS